MGPNGWRCGGAPCSNNAPMCMALWSVHGAGAMRPCPMSQSHHGRGLAAMRPCLGLRGWQALEGIMGARVPSSAPIYMPDDGARQEPAAPAQRAFGPPDFCECRGRVIQRRQVHPAWGTHGGPPPRPLKPSPTMCGALHPTLPPWIRCRWGWCTHPGQGKTTGRPSGSSTSRRGITSTWPSTGDRLTMQADYGHGPLICTT